MEVTPELLSAARKGKRPAVIELLPMYYPVVWRMSVGLTGRADVGRGVVKFVMPRSLRALPNWHDEADPARWFCHHTLLTTRRTSRKHLPTTTNDVLLNVAPPDTGYVAFIRALRSLPMQQRESFILTHGEQMNMRNLAVAMDCSTTAATNHLREATERLRELSQQQTDAYTSRMAAAYKRQSPDEELGVTGIRGRVKRFVIPWAIKRTLRFLFSLILLAAAIWAVWWIWKIVHHSLQ